MKFAEIHWLWLAAVLLPACLLVVQWAARRRRKSLDQVVAPRLHDILVRSVDHRKRWFRASLFLLAVGLLLAALSRPLYGIREAQVERAGVDVLLALDVSRSMMAEDTRSMMAEGAPTNRLSSAKESIIRLLERPSRDRFGLIIFAGEAYLMSPLTQDHGALLRTLQAVSVGAVSKPGTDIAAAIKLAQRSYDETQKRGKALVFITDGEQLQGDAVLAAREAASKGIAIFTVGVGSSAGARVPDRQFAQQLRFVKNEFGREVVSRLNEQVMKQIAAAAHGFYSPLGPKGDGLIGVSERGVQPLARGTQIRPSKDMREYFQWPLGLAISLLFWELLVNERKKSDSNRILKPANKKAAELPKVQPAGPSIFAAVIERESADEVAVAPAESDAPVMGDSK